MTHFLHLPFKLLLPGLVGLLALLTLGTDLSSWIKIKQTEQTLQQLQIEKEKLMNKKMVSLSSQSTVNHPIFLEPLKAGFILVKTLAASHLLLTHMQFSKPLTTFKQNAFEIALDVKGDYFTFLTFINQLDQLGWNISWQTLHVASNSLMIKQKILNKSGRETDALYPLEIKLKLAIADHYCLTPPDTSSHGKTILLNFDHSWSPFVLRRHAGKLMVNGVVTNLVVTESRDSKQALILPAEVNQT